MTADDPRDDPDQPSRPGRDDPAATRTPGCDDLAATSTPGRDDPDDTSTSDHDALATSRRRVLSAAAATATATALPLQFSDSGRAAVDVEHRVVSYYTGWSRYDREYYPEDVPLDRITDLNYAFLTVEQDGTVTYADAWGDQENLAAFRELKREHDTTCYLSIGGWSDSQYFSNAAATAENRERFASTAIEILREYEFDGLDLDWEYPGGGGHEQNVTREDDPENFVLLLEELRSQLDAAESADDATYDVTIAASANQDTAGQLPIEEIEPYLEYVTVMSYDFAGGWSAETGHNAPLYGDGASVANSMAWWAEQPIPREKLLVGVPFYGRTFTGVETGGAVDGSPEDGPATLDGLGRPFGGDGMVLYGDLDEEYSTEGSYVEFRDEAAAVPYRFSAEAATFVSYDDAESIRQKAAFAAEEGFGGVMCWEQPGDPEGELLAAVREPLQLGSGLAPCEDAGAAAGETLADGSTVCDVDGDGAYMDVTGDGSVTNSDVTEFFANQHAPPWDERADLFDFDGDDAVGQSDVVALFEHVVGQ